MNISNYYYKNKIDPSLASQFQACFEPVLSLQLDQMQTIDNNSANYFKLSALKLFSQMIQLSKEKPTVDLNHLLNVYLNNTSKLDLTDLLNLLEVYCSVDNDLFLNKKIVKTMISQVLEDLCRSIPDRHPDDCIQLLNQLSSLRNLLPFEIESISYDTWVELGRALNLFEKNVVSMFHLVTHLAPLLRLSSEWGFILRDKFFFKLQELLAEKKDQRHPYEILEFCMTLSKRELADSASLAPFVPIFNQLGTLRLLTDRQLLLLLQLDAEFDILEKESFDWIIEHKSNQIVNLEHLPELLDVFIALKRNPLNNRQVQLEQSIKDLLDSFNQRNHTLNQKINLDPFGQEASYFRSEGHLFERFQKVLRIHKSHQFTPEMFYKKFGMTISILVKGWALLGTKSESTLVNIKYDIICLGENFDYLLDFFNS